MSKRNYSRELQLKQDRINDWEKNTNIIDLENYERNNRTKHWDFD